MTKKEKKPQKDKSLNKKVLQKGILEIFKTHPLQNFNYKQVASRLNKNDDLAKRLINMILYELTEKEILEEVYTGKFKYNSRLGYITGIVDMNQHGSAIIVSEEIDDEIFVSQENMNQALPGDLVKVFVYKKNKKKVLGEITEILNRANTKFIGIINISTNYAFLNIETKKVPFDIYIPIKNLNKAKHGQKVIAQITEWLKNSKSPTGEVIEILGYPGENETEMHAILADFDLPYKFPENVEKDADKISDLITPDEIKKRKDFRKITTFTIDPIDAKDFDDAISIKHLKNEHWEIGVHIADVSFYVEPDSVLDQEAFKRGTSVYLVDRVVPMLPERLSNQVCSLRPKEDKLCFSAVFELDDEGKLYHEWFGRTVINSDYRFNYEEAQKIIDTSEGKFHEELATLNSIAKKMRNNRFAKGAIGFSKSEVKFNLDENGKPLGVFFVEEKDSNNLIEEFMLLANKKVAEFVGKKESKIKPKTFVYRIHDSPDIAKLEIFSNFIKRFGYKIKTNEKSFSGSLNTLLESIKTKKEKGLIETLAIRSMARAEYSTNNIGHYGLAFKYYTHFTSPIRRYPDVMVHRLLERYMEDKKSVDTVTYEKMCKHSSEMEQRATNAERASVKYKQVEFMSDKIGQIFKGVISGVSEWGIYVELVDNKCEGMISLRDMRDDFYVIDTKNYCLTGKRTDKKYQLGDPVIVEIVRTNLAKKQLDFKLIENDKD